jgi:predicted metalloprotease with PDZ domain
MPNRCLRFVILSAIALAGTSSAQLTRGPVQLEQAMPVAIPVDRPFAGQIQLDVDATDTAHRIFMVRERIPVQGGSEETLLYPRWEVASHGPSLTVTDLAGLVVRADGQPLRWRRDPIEPHAFRVKIPEKTRMVDVRFQMVAGDDLLTPDVVAVPWQRLILYPAGWYSRNIPVVASVTLPVGMQAYTSLEPASSHDATMRFAPVSLETLMDSPVLAGRYAARVQLEGKGGRGVMLDLVAKRPDDLAIPAARIGELRRLVVQARAIFGLAPFPHYDFLARMSDDGSAGGTEHRASSENALASSFFRAWQHQLPNRDLLAHEFVHAWNGLYRTPADLWAPTPNVPVSGSLLWVYEGQTEFWGRILAARAGQFSADEMRDRLAVEAAEIAARPGRAWRPLSDDVNYPSFMLRQPTAWRDWQRRRDY